MKIVFVSNYINHHQMPFCREMYSLLGEGNFYFAALFPMEEERRGMGWQSNAACPFEVRYYEEPERVHRLIMECDVLLFGGMDHEEFVYERMEKDLTVIRIMERIYKEGQWKAVSPRGLLAKYKEFTRYRNKHCYLLCAGAYVASDFALIGAFPDKKYTWGYFPEVRRHDIDVLFAKKGRAVRSAPNTVRILWSGRFVDFKHIEVFLSLLERLAASYLPAHPDCRLHADIVGGGYNEEEVRKRLAALPEKLVAFHGFLSPEEVRGFMEASDIYVFTSGQGEGWGAVVNEAMNSGCAVLAGVRAGAVPSLIRQGENGLIYENHDENDLYEKMIWLIEHPEAVRSFGKNAVRTMEETWNGQLAAGRLLQFAECVVKGEPYNAPVGGPMSNDPVLRPFPKVKRLCDLRLPEEG